MAIIEAALEAVESEHELLAALPPLVNKHGRSEVEQSLQTIGLTKAQVKECFKQLDSSLQRLVWSPRLAP